MRAKLINGPRDGVEVPDADVDWQRHVVQRELLAMNCPEAVQEEPTRPSRLPPQNPRPS
jgi:hypothetical protein